MELFLAALLVLVWFTPVLAAMWDLQRMPEDAFRTRGIPRKWVAFGIFVTQNLGAFLWFAAARRWFQSAAEESQPHPV